MCNKFYELMTLNEKIEWINNSFNGVHDSNRLNAIYSSRLIQLSNDIELTFNERLLFEELLKNRKVIAWKNILND